MRGEGGRGPASRAQMALLRGEGHVCQIVAKPVGSGLIRPDAGGGLINNSMRWLDIVRGRKRSVMYVNVPYIGNLAVRQKTWLGR